MSGIGRRAFARIFLLASGLVFAGACDNVDPPLAPPETPRLSLNVDPTTYYVIRSVGSGKALDVEGAGCCNGAWVHQWDYQGLSNQQWRIVNVGGNWYKIVARHSGRVMDVRSGSSSDGAVIHQWDYRGLANQQFEFTDDGSGSYAITARHSGKSLTVSGSVNSNGAEVRQYNYQGLPSQRFTILPF
jgi:glucan 1,4-alpha-glucosidase